MELWSALSLCRDVRGTYRIELWSALGDVRALLPQVSTGVVGASGLVVIAPDSEVRGTGLESRGRGWFVLERVFFRHCQFYRQGFVPRQVLWLVIRANYPTFDIWCKNRTSAPRFFLKEICEELTMPDFPGFPYARSSAPAGRRFSLSRRTRHLPMFSIHCGGSHSS